MFTVRTARIYSGTTVLWHMKKKLKIQQQKNSTRGLDVCEPESHVQVVAVDLRRGVVEVAEEAKVERLGAAWN